MPSHPSGDRVPNELHVVANRLPVAWSPTDGWRRAPGGLVTALEALTRRRRIDWHGSSSSVGTDARLPTWSHGPLHAIAVAGDVADRAIDGLANSTLWPALHGLTDRVRWHDHWWDAYRSFNEQFAETVATTVGPGATVWVHDYQLLLVPHELRRRRPDVTIGLSIHTPFAEAIGELPVADELAEALRAPHLVGVQRSIDREVLVTFAGPTDAVVSPVSIDPQSLQAVARDPAAGLLLERFGVGLDGRQLVVGVDRMDYTKGIPERLRALDHAFRRRDIDPERIDYVQIAQPTRTTLADYRHFATDVERLGHQVATEWLRRDGTPPIRLVNESLDRRLVAALLAGADVAAVTPVRDGMNLVAKEFSIVNEVHGGALVLSHGAGAHDELADGSVTVDGGDPVSVAGGLTEALVAPVALRRARATWRAERVRAWTAADWAEHFCAELAGVSVS